MKKGLLLGIYLQEDGTIHIDANVASWEVKDKQGVIDAVEETFNNSTEELIDFLTDTHSWK